MCDDVLGFPLNLGRAINSPLDSIITIQRIFFYVIYALWVFCIFSKLDAVFFSFLPVNDSDLLKICLRGCQADLFLFKETLPERPKGSNRFWTDIFSVVLLVFSETLSCVVYFTYKYLHKWCMLSTDMYTLLLILLLLLVFLSRHFSGYDMVWFHFLQLIPDILVI